MKSFVFILVTVAVFSTTAESKHEDYLRAIDGRVVGGQITTVYSHPYQLSFMNKNHHICGASIIAEKWALTAAHCVRNKITADLTVRCGSSIIGLGGSIRKVKNTYTHPKFDYDTIDYDLALLELEEELPISIKCKPIEITDVNVTIPDGTIAEVTGWGSTTEGDPILALILQKVSIPVVNHDVCQREYGDIEITDRMFCAGFENGGKDSCQGDSGGPLIIDGKLTGVVSFGKGCARPEYPGVYANIAAMREFVFSRDSLAKERANLI